MGETLTVDAILKLTLEQQKELFVRKLRENDESFYPLLNRIALESDYPETRYYARKILHLMRKNLRIPDEFESSPAPAAPEVNISTLLAALSAEDYREKIASLKGIMKYRLYEAAPHILRALREERDPLIVSYMIKVTGAIGDEAAVDELGRFVQHKDARVRANAVEALDTIGSLKSYPFVIGAIQDDDNRVRANAIKALKRVGRVNTMKLLKAMIYSRKIWLVDSACHVLGSFDNPEVIDLLRVALKYNALSVNLKVKSVLEKLAAAGNAEAKELLGTVDIGFDEDRDVLAVEEELRRDIGAVRIEFEDEAQQGATDADAAAESLRRGTVKERIEAVLALTRRGGARSLETMKTEADACDNTKVLATLVKAAGRLGSHIDIAWIERFLDHADARVRANTVEALRLVDIEATWPRIEKVMQAEVNNRVLGNAILALSAVKSVETLPYLRKLVALDAPWGARSAFFVICEANRDDYIPLLEEIRRGALPPLRDEIHDHLKILREKGNPVALAILKRAEEKPQHAAAPAAAPAEEPPAPRPEPKAEAAPPPAPVPEPPPVAVAAVHEPPAFKGDPYADDEPFVTAALDMIQSGSIETALAGLEILRRVRAPRVLPILEDQARDPRKDLAKAAEAALPAQRELHARRAFSPSFERDEELAFNEKTRFARLVETVKRPFGDFMQALGDECEFRANKPVIRQLTRHLLAAGKRERETAFLSACELAYRKRKARKQHEGASDYLPLFLGPAFGKEGLPFLRKLMWDNVVDPGVCGMAAVSLGLTVRQDALDILREGYYDASRGPIYRDIARAIGYHAASGVPEAFEFLARSLEEDSTMRRQDAMHGLAVSGDIRALAHLSEQFRHGDVYLRESIDSGIDVLIKNLGRIAGRLNLMQLNVSEVLTDRLNVGTPKSPVELIDQPDRIFEYVYKRLS